MQSKYIHKSSTTMWAKAIGICFLFAFFISIPLASALTPISGPALSGTRHFSDDMDLTLTSGYYPNAYVLGAIAAGQTVTIDPNKTVTLHVADSVADSPYNMFGVYSQAVAGKLR